MRQQGGQGFEGTVARALPPLLAGMQTTGRALFSNAAGTIKYYYAWWWGMFLRWPIRQSRYLESFNPVQSVTPATFS